MAVWVFLRGVFYKYDNVFGYFVTNLSYKGETPPFVKSFQTHKYNILKRVKNFHTIYCGQFLDLKNYADYNITRCAPFGAAA